MSESMAAESEPKITEALILFVHDICRLWQSDYKEVYKLSKQCCPVMVSSQS